MFDPGLKARIEDFTQDLDERTVREFLSRLDGDYFDQFAPAQTRQHMMMASGLSAEQPAQVELRHRDDGKFDLTIVALDYFSELSIICGLISAFGFDIDSGQIYTFSSAAANPAPETGSRRPRRPRHAEEPRPVKIVDVFTVSARDEFRPEKQEELRVELNALILLLRERLFSEARDRLNRRLVESLDAIGARADALYHPRSEERRVG